MDYHSRVSTLRETADYPDGPVRAAYQRGHRDARHAAAEIAAEADAEIARLRSEMHVMYLRALSAERLARGAGVPIGSDAECARASEEVKP